MLKDAQKVLKKSVIEIKNTRQMINYIKKVFSSPKLSTRYAYFIKSLAPQEKIKFLDGNKSLCEGRVHKLLDSFFGGSNKFQEKMGQGIPYPEEKLIIIPVFEAMGKMEILVIESDGDLINFINEDLAIVLKNIEIYRQLKIKCDELVNLTHLDEVTGLYNQRKLIEDLDDAISFHDQLKVSFSLMFIDIDFFKKVNDSYGHIIGSEILKDLGYLLKDLVRSTDDVYRFGGDEFIILLREVDIDTVRHIGLRILNSVLKHDFELSNGDRYKMSISIGIAEYPTDAKSSKEVIQLADNMMYESKKTGRGKVIHLGKEVEHVDASSK